MEAMFMQSSYHALNRKVLLRGRTIVIGIAEESDLPAVKDLDDICFQSHRGSSADEIQQVFNKGVIIVVREQGELVAMSQVLLQSCGILKLRLLPNEMFSYGTGIHPNWRGSGLAKILMNAQKEIAARFGKGTITSTTRVENAPSLAMRFRVGFQLVAFEPQYFPEERVNAGRVIMQWHASSTTDKRSHGPIVLASENNDSKCSSPWFVPVSFGESPDVTAHKLMTHALGTNRVGTELVSYSPLARSGGIIFSFSQSPKSL